MLTREDFLGLISEGKSLTVEFKGEGNRKISDDEIVEAVVCLSNAEGGYLFLGVEDDRRITGARPRKGDKVDITGLPAMVYNKTNPSLQVDVQLIEHQGKEVVAFRVPASISAVGTRSGLYKKRIIGSDGKPVCVPYSPHEYVSDLTIRGQLDYTAAPMNDLDESALDSLEIERLFSIIDTYRGDQVLLDMSQVDALKALGILKLSGDRLVPTIAGLLLLGKKDILNDRIPTHEVAFQFFQGTDILINEFFKNPLLRTLETIWNYFDARNEVNSVQMGLFRADISDYDDKAFREALNNAVLHRDYSRLGTVHIQWYEDCIQISNPGGFVRGVSVDNILTVPPTPRNPLLADIFKRIGLVERSGRGVDLIYTGQIKNGRFLPDYSQSNPEVVVLRIPGGPARLEFIQLLQEHEHKYQKPLAFESMLVLDAVYHQGPLPMDKLIALLQRSENEVRAVLQSLIDHGYVERKGKRRGMTYMLSSGLYRRLGMPSAYVRTRGFDRIQQEQMVLQHIKAHGRITRGEVMELCMLNENQAYGVLKKMANSQKIVPKGTKKGRWYERPPLVD